MGRAQYMPEVSIIVRPVKDNTEDGNYYVRGRVMYFIQSGKPEGPSLMTFTGQADVVEKGSTCNEAIVSMYRVMKALYSLRVDKMLHGKQAYTAYVIFHNGIKPFEISSWSARP